MTKAWPVFFIVTPPEPWKQGIESDDKHAQERRGIISYIHGRHTRGIVIYQSNEAPTRSSTGLILCIYSWRYVVHWVFSIQVLSHNLVSSFYFIFMLLRLQIRLLELSNECSFFLEIIPSMMSFIKLTVVNVMNQRRLISLVQFQAFIPCSEDYIDAW